jgi:putative aldouronate transport system permease protein
MGNRDYGKEDPMASYRVSKPELAFQVMNTVFLLFVTVITLYPFIHILSVSFSSNAEAIRVGLHFWPKEWDFKAYADVLSAELTWIGYQNTLFRTIVGTVLSILFTAVTAYPLAKKYFPLRNVWVMLIIFTMIFSGGLVPNYLLIRELGLLNSLWALILPVLISPFNLMIMKNFFETIPESLEESARMDGASEWLILWKIVFPLSMPVIATIALWSAVGHWNAFFDAILYINDKSKYVLQIIMRKLILEHQMVNEFEGANPALRKAQETIEAATIVVSTLPILIFYPFLQKHFVKGVLLGSVKG